MGRPAPPLPSGAWPDPVPQPWQGPPRTVGLMWARAALAWGQWDSRPQPGLKGCGGAGRLRGWPSLGEGGRLGVSPGRTPRPTSRQRAYQRGVCRIPVLTSLEPQHSGPGLLGHTLPHGYARVSPELTATPHPCSQPRGDPRSQRGAVGPGTPKTHEPQGGPGPPGRRNPGNNALRGTDFPSTEKIESNRMATSCICAQGVTHTETSQRGASGQVCWAGCCRSPARPRPPRQAGPPSHLSCGPQPTPSSWAVEKGSHGAGGMPWGASRRRETQPEDTGCMRRAYWGTAGPCSREVRVGMPAGCRGVGHECWRAGQGRGSHEDGAAWASFCILDEGVRWLVDSPGYEASKARHVGAETDNAQGPGQCAVQSGPGSQTRTLGEVGPACRVGTAPGSSRRILRAPPGVFPLRRRGVRAGPWGRRCDP
ncbi:collagen alpha-1(I) chain-like [Mustela nigripes]|uniref:collagen alpha-1(I) chain-like n=1 Tax=Mustela nigripes TaxID=77151 RepID=UPI002815FBB8|nr:collagen alpha-1(I) chain-like [Mustela nigripes]XP_059230139.1 collagen alpha-1(I) chain-like [Mustela nigripes]XP_059230140.1 collagen alpha-1(I) chain-like [Mustela nigripes]XP_059230141.1 collagen alpha-1(I) chain-like [Mustela nigripes]XP_059230142.1 collagen alpha-1(I) chain-like [Mustela nigripes]